MGINISGEGIMITTDPQKLRREAREFLDKAGVTADRAVRRLLLERALRLTQKAVILEEQTITVDGELQSKPVSNDDSTQAASPGPRRRA